MPITRVAHIHNNSVLWPQHKTEREIIEVRATTLDEVWQTTYQGFSTSPKGRIFEWEWWDKQNRFKIGTIKPAARYISIDTALSDTETSARSAIVVFDFFNDRKVGVRHVWSDRVQYPQLVAKTLELATYFNDDGYKANLLFGIIIENKLSGVSLIQSMMQTAPKWMRSLIVEYNPKIAKEVRWGEAAVWCKLGMVLLPEPDASTDWLMRFEELLYAAPGIDDKDELDAFSQGIIKLSPQLSLGYWSMTHG